ncbi:hypothetical protein [Alteromonas sp. McT4-15]|nr:hypothetical protein [Alteromonas sp. McT4-15]
MVTLFLLVDGYVQWSQHVQLGTAFAISTYSDGRYLAMTNTRSIP